MDKEKENRMKFWAGEILDSSLDILAGDNFVEAFAGVVGEKLGLQLPGMLALFLPSILLAI